MQRKIEANKKLSAQDLKQREVTRNFNHVAKLVLTPLERETLHKSLRQYQRSRDVDKLHHMMVFMLTTSEKQKLFPYVRAMLPEVDRERFDELSVPNQSTSKSRPTTNKARSSNFLHPSHNTDIQRKKKKKTSFRKNLKVITLNKDEDDYIGFSIRGGSENGLGIYISQIDPLSPADYSGLEVGDEILDVNNIQFNNLTLNGAVSVLTGSDVLKLTINRMRKVPEWKKSKEKTIWYDVRRGKLISLPKDESQIDETSIRERRVLINIYKPTDYIGMNIRGGNEYGLGIYVSRLDRGGLAERNHVCVGDQIVAVNGTSFENVNHTSAVEFLRAHITLNLTLKAVGRYPAYKEIYQEYTWSENTGRPPNRPYKNEPDCRLVVSETRIQSRYTNKSTTSTNHMGRMSIQQEVLLPRKHDIAFHSPYEEWTSSGFGEGDNNGSLDNLASRNRNGRNSSDIESDYLESGSEQDDYMAFLERKRRQESKIGHQHPEASTSFSTQQNRKIDDDVIKTHILPDRHTTVYMSSPIIQNSNPYLAYAKVHNPHKPNKHGIVYVSSPEPEIHKPQTVYKPYDPLKSKSTPSLLTTERMSSAYQNSDNYDHLHTVRPREPSIDYSFDRMNIGTPISPSKNENIYSSVDELHPKIETVVVQVHDDQHKKQGINLLEDEEQSSSSVEDRIKRLEHRKSHLGSSEIDRIAGDTDSSSEKATESPQLQQTKKGKTSTWASLKKKLKGTEKEKKKKKMNGTEAPTSLLKKRGVFENNFGSQMMNNHYVDNYNMMMLEENTRSMLRKDECDAVIRHVKYYHEHKDLDRLIDVLLQLLDTPEKLQLLKEVRGIIFPYHIALFDNKVNIYEIKEYDRTATKLHLPLHHNNQRSSKPHKNLMTTVVDEDGHFHIKTVDQHKRDVNHEKEVIKVMRSSLEVSSQSDDDSNDDDDEDDDDVKEGSYDLMKSRKKTGGNLTSYTTNDDNDITVYISKHKLHLGLVLKGGEGEFPTPVRIHKILPSGAAADDSNIKPGMILMSVDDKSLRFLSLPEVLAALKKCYNNKSSVAMKLVLKQPEYR